MLDTTASRQRYEDRLRRVILHLHDHLDEPLDLITLADLAAMSPYHWHRVYCSFVGETVFQTVSRLKLHRAAQDLVSSDRPIADIARRAGYAGVAPFNRAFAKAHGVPPGRYRREKRPLLENPTLIARSLTMKTIALEQRPPFRLAAARHRGPYFEISRAFMEVFGTIAARQLHGSVRGMIGVYFDDPSSTPAADLRSLAGAVVPETFPIEAPLEEYRMPATRTAILTHKGPYAELPAAYDYLYGHWLPASGEEAADLPPYENYLNSPQDTPQAELLTEICVPLKG